MGGATKGVAGLYTKHIHNHDLQKEERKRTPCLFIGGGKKNIKTQRKKREKNKNEKNKK